MHHVYAAQYITCSSFARDKLLAAAWTAIAAGDLHAADIRYQFSPYRLRKVPSRDIATLGSGPSIRMRVDAGAGSTGCPTSASADWPATNVRLAQHSFGRAAHMHVNSDMGWSRGMCVGWRTECG
jgi:hypothetical protein